MRANQQAIGRMNRPPRHARMSKLSLCVRKSRPQLCEEVINNREQPQTMDEQTPSMDRGEHGQQIGIPQWPKTNLDTTANTKMWGRQQPQSNNSEYASHMGKQPKQSVREEKLAPNSKMHGKDIPDFCVRISAYARGKIASLCARINRPSGG